jgi:hypothetical protein
MANLLDDIIKFALRQRYPNVTPPVTKFDKKKDKEYLAKSESPEAKAVKKLRDATQRRINAGDYDPYFNIADRFTVDRYKYPVASQPNQTLSVLPAKQETIDKYRKLYGNPQSKRNLLEAYEKGIDRPDTSDWYFMGQLEQEFINEYGEELGRKKFQEMFADPMAAWTGGADPQANLLMAMFDNYRRTQGAKLPENTFDYPYPIGGRFLGNNAKSASKIEAAGGINPTTNPKRFNFSTNFQGAGDRATMDEQMMTIGYGMQVPTPKTYGAVEEVAIELADKKGVTPMKFQEVVWHGGTGKEGKPMIQFVNEAIERTSAITGLTPKEVVRGMVKGSIPVFGVGAAAPMTNDILNYFSNIEGNGS